MSAGTSLLNAVGLIPLSKLSPGCWSSNHSPGSQSHCCGTLHSAEPAKQRAWPSGRLAQHRHFSHGLISHTKNKVFAAVNVLYFPSFPVNKSQFRYCCPHGYKTDCQLPEEWLLSARTKKTWGKKKKRKT